MNQSEVLGHNVLTSIKAMAAIFFVWASEKIYMMLLLIGFFPENVRDFIRDTKEIFGLLTTIVILLIYVKRLIKKGNDKEQ